MNISKVHIENFKIFKGSFDLDLNKGINIRWCLKKYAVIKIWQSRNKELFLNYDNQNYTLLSFLPKHKGKEKRNKIIRQTKLFVPKLFTSIYRRPCLKLQRLAL